MKIKYRKPTLIEQMSDAIADSKKPIDYFELSASEFQSIINNIDKTKTANGISYSFKGIKIKVSDE